MRVVMRMKSPSLMMVVVAVDIGKTMIMFVIAVMIRVLAMRVGMKVFARRFFLYQDPS